MTPATNFSYSADWAYNQLKVARPGRTARNQTRMRELLTIDVAVLKGWLKLHPKASVMYIGMAGPHGILLKWDRTGRVNAEWVENQSLLPRYKAGNNINEVAAV